MSRLSPFMHNAICAVESAEPNIIALIPNIPAWRDPAAYKADLITEWNDLPVRVTFRLWGKPSEMHELDSVMVLDAKGNDLHALNLSAITDQQEAAWLEQVEESL